MTLREEVRRIVSDNTMIRAKDGTIDINATEDMMPDGIGDQ